MKYGIIGASAAGLTAAKTIRQVCPQDTITVVSSDSEVYTRTLLYRLLSGEKMLEQLRFVPQDFIKTIDWMPAQTVLAVKPFENRLVTNQCTIEYDQLLLAAGASSIIPPLPHFQESKNLFGLRNLPDVKKIDTAIAAGGKRCIIIGSGLVGLDAAYAMCARGIHPDVIEMGDRISPLQLDAYSAKQYQNLFEAHGCTFYFSRRAVDSQIDTNEQITSITLEDGTCLPCDFIIVAAGTRPTVAFLKDSGISFDRSVTVGPTLQTNIPNIWAAGDITGISGTWAEAMQQGEIAARNMCGEAIAYSLPHGQTNPMNFYGLSTLSIGINDPVKSDEILVQQIPDQYCRVLLRNGIARHVILQGKIEKMSLWQKLVREAIPIASLPRPIFDLQPEDLAE